MARIYHTTCILASVAILCIAVFFRCWDLGRVPGVNGDEAWAGVQAERLLNGQCVPARTPSGNPLNPFFLAQHVLVHRFTEPSFAALRMPALVSGLAALLANFLLCQRAFGLRMAWLTTLIHAVLPINIAYSRFAWDASQSLLFTLPVVYSGGLAYREPLGRRRWTVIGFFSLAFSVLVHPTNVFVAPFLAIMLAAAWRDRLTTWWKSPALRRIGVPLGLLVAMILTWPVMPRIAANLGAGSQYGAFVSDFGDLFTGMTVFEYIPGSLAMDHGRANSPTRIALVALGIVVAGLAAFALFQSITRGKSDLDLWLVAGWTASVGGFFAVAGPAAIAPHFERYAICLVAPTVLILGRGLDWWMRPTTRFTLITTPLLCLLGGCLLATFKSHYFDEFNDSAGRSHLTFRTAGVEPKQWTMELIAREREPGVPLVVQTSAWWLYWPLQYLAYGYDNLAIELRSADDPRLLDQQAIAGMETWIVEFAEEDAGWRLARSWASLGVEHGCGAERHEIADAAGRELLLLIRLPAR